MFIVLTVLSSAGAQGLSREDLDALLRFRAEHLEVRPTSEVEGGAAYVDPAWGPHTYGWGAPVATLPTVEREWTVYQGPRRLAVPEYLQEVGLETDAERLQRRIRGGRGAGGFFGTVAALGFIGGVGGVAMSFADDERNRQEWTAAGVASFGGGLLSAVIASAARHRADTLEADYSKSMDLQQVQVDVRRHNDELRQDLGLTPDQVYRELAPEPAPAP